MPYLIKQCHTSKEKGECFSIRCYPWGKEYTPETTGSFLLLEGQGFLLQMQCLENHPTAHYYKNSDPVHKDSCMEAFIDFFPQSGKGYINFEINANGAMKCSIGTQRNSPEHPRYYFEKEGISVPRPRVCIEDDRWELSLLIPLSFLKTAYGRDDFAPGQVLRGNFHKCGEETPIPHFGTLFPVSSPSPDFHRPEDFGELIIR
ncbi:MAG TPA: carbohydrate-binding family 9-like protein [Firmicutes bacterium]|nr:carbohydrate-binding family 9-like protein [Bacillota bacterium]